LRIPTLAALAGSFFLSACILFPAPSRLLLPLTVAAPEVSPWIVLLNLLATAMALVFHQRTAAPFFAACALLAAWPLMQIGGVERAMDRQALGRARRKGATLVALDCFRGAPGRNIEPEALPLNMRFYRPRSDRLSPVLIDVYGGAWQRGSPEDDRRFDSYMASRGYAVFAIDYRHAPLYRFPAQLEDVRAAIAFIHANARRYGADPGRLALCGRSAGAQLALLAAYEKGPVPIGAAIGFYGPTDLIRGYAEPPTPDPLHVRAVLETYIGGGPSQFPDRYREASPVSHVGGSLPPTLLIQGGRDHIVKPVFAAELYGKLRDSGNRAFLLEIPWAEHAFDAVFSGLGNQLARFYLEEFLKETIGA